MEKWKCSICETEYLASDGVGFNVSEQGNNLCEFCAHENNVVFFSIRPIRNKYYGYAELNAEEVSTGYHPTRQQARNRTVTMIALVWGNGIDTIEED